MLRDLKFDEILILSEKYTAIIRYLVQIWENKLQVDNIDINFGVHFAIDMNNVIIFKTAHNLKNN